MPADSPRGLRASLDATFEARPAGASARVISTAPLELRGPFSGSALPSYFLRNVTAGILEGDDYQVTLRTEPGARVHIGPTAATKVFASGSRGSMSRLRLEAMPGSTLWHSAGVTILHEGACLTQDVEIVLHPGAAVAYLEVLALGRLARGERLAFSRYATSLTVRPHDGDAVYEERFTLEPGASMETIEAAMGGAGVIGSLLLLSAAAAEAPALEEAAGVYAGASVLPNGAGVLVRALGERAEVVARLLDSIASEAVAHRGVDDTPVRQPAEQAHERPHGVRPHELVRP